MISELRPLQPCMQRLQDSPFLQAGPTRVWLHREAFAREFSGLRLMNGAAHRSPLRQSLRCTWGSAPRPETQIKACRHPAHKVQVHGHTHLRKELPAPAA